MVIVAEYANKGRSEEGRCGHNPGLVRIGGILRHESPFDGNWQLCEFHNKGARADLQFAE